jgi:hypothetical protein
MEDFFAKQLKLKFFYYTLNYPNGESFKRCQVTLWGPTGLYRLGGLSLMTGDEEVKVLGKLGSEYAFVIESTKAGDQFLPDQNVYMAWKGGKLFDLSDLNYGCAESFGALEE